MQYRLRIAFMTAAALVVSVAASANPLGDGHLRLELTGLTGIYSGSTDRGGDHALMGAVEYEMPMTPRLSLGLRALPLFIYEQGDAPWKSNTDTVRGLGFGLAGRLYAVKQEQRGLFAEVSGHMIATEGKLDGNSATVNFVPGFGVGYQWRCGLNMALKYQHISNAGLGDRNAGANSVGLALGFRF